jgi:deoxycytidine triphosphate deaminase
VIRASQTFELVTLGTCVRPLRRPATRRYVGADAPGFEQLDVFADTLACIYLADHEIRALGAELQFVGPNPEHPFDPDRQIQPCSVDLRISDVFWKPRHRRRLWRRLMPWREIAIDLRRASLHDLDPIRDWKRFDVSEGQFVTIKPGHTIMGRVYETFRMPTNCAGKIEGRSSFARLGLSIHCTGDFINPGWQGYMPLQLSNVGPYPLRLAPYFSICQLMLVPLASEPERSYGDEALRSKYVNDEGGPSLWWRDARVEELQERLGQANAHEAIRQEIVDRVRFQSTEVLARFQRDIDRKQVHEVENADQILDEFARREDRRRLLDTVLLASPLLFAGGVIASVFVAFDTWTAVLIALTIVSAIAALIAYERRDDGYLGSSELRALRPPDSEA